MKTGVDFPQATDGDVNISCRNIQVGVTKQLRDVSDVASVVTQMAGTSMSYTVQADFLLQSSHTGITLKDFQQTTPCDSLSPAVHDYGLLILLDIVQTAFIQVSLQVMPAKASARHNSVPAVLGFPNE